MSATQPWSNGLLMLGRAKYCCNTHSCALSQTHCRQDRLGTATVATTVIFPRSPRIDLFVLFNWSNVHTDINMNEKHSLHSPCASAIEAENIKKQARGGQWVGTGAGVG